MLTNIFKNLDWRHWILSHFIWIALVSAVIIGFNSWKTEHDARLIAQQQIKISEVQVQTLQKQITDRNAEATKQEAPIVKIIHDVQTVPQAVAKLPEVVNQPLPQPIVKQADNSVIIPQPDVIPLFQQVADDKVCRIEVDKLTGNLNSEVAIVKQKDDEIVALKKPKSFWSKVKGTVKTLGIGIGIGALIAAKI